MSLTFLFNSNLFLGKTIQTYSKVDMLLITLLKKELIKATNKYIEDKTKELFKKYIDLISNYTIDIGRDSYFLIMDELSFLLIEESTLHYRGDMLEKYYSKRRPQALLLNLKTYLK